tara:strand:- start:3853 stop:4080 length:228 start_codon:yes stop_codon:yes gene_type:complete
MNTLVKKHEEWLKKTITISNSFLISMDGTKDQSLIVVLENNFSSMDAKEYLRDIGVPVTSVKRLEKIDAQDQWFS